MLIVRLSHWEVRGRWVRRRMVVGRVIVRMSRGAVQMLNRFVSRLFAMLKMAMILGYMLMRC